MASRSTSVPANASAASSQPIDADLARLFEQRKTRVKELRAEGLRMLEARKWKQAKELCRAWVDLDLGNGEAWRCFGEALQGDGRHQDAVNALRKAKQYDPDDRSLDAAISRSQRAIVAEFYYRQGR